MRRLGRRVCGLRPTTGGRTTCPSRRGRPRRSERVLRRARRGAQRRSTQRSLHNGQVPRATLDSVASSLGGSRSFPQDQDRGGSQALPRHRSVRQAHQRDLRGACGARQTWLRQRNYHPRSPTPTRWQLRWHWCLQQLEPTVCAHPKPSRLPAWTARRQRSSPLRQLLVPVSARELLLPFGRLSRQVSNFSNFGPKVDELREQFSKFLVGEQRTALCVGADVKF